MSTNTPIVVATEMPTTSPNSSDGETWNTEFTDNNEASSTTESTIASTDNCSSETPTINKQISPTTTSSTAYSFSGSSLGNEPININKEKKATDNSCKTAGGDKDSDKNDDSIFECNICLDNAKDAVVSLCGHLFCWPCLHQWLETRPSRKLCPVCKAAIGKDKVIPLYGRNSSKQEDPRNKVPPRPAGQRTEPEPQQGFQGFSFGDGFHMSFGIGAFPFGYFASSLNFSEPRPAPANRGTMQYEDEQQLSKLFLYLAFLCIAWLLFA